MHTRTSFVDKSLRGAFAVAAIALATTISGAAFAAEEIAIKLSGDMEVPPVVTSAMGNGTLKINDDMTISGQVSTAGIAATMAHIHIGKAGTNGPVTIPLNRSGDNQWMVPPDAKLTDAQYQAYRSGELYVNVHSAAHPGGEIRGQLMPGRAPMKTPGGY